MTEKTLKHSVGMGQWTLVLMKLEQDLLDLGCQVLQMKEKFGELRVYYRHHDSDVCDKANELIEKAIKDCASLDEGTNI